METHVVNAFTPQVREELLQSIDVRFEDLVDLDGFENYVFADGDRIIRITHDSHRTVDQLLGELEFVRHLKKHGAAVAAPLPFTNHKFIKSLGDFHIVLFERAPGHQLSYEIPFAEGVIHSWGKQIARMHRISTGFNPEHPRLDWREDENHNFSKRIPQDQPLVREAALQLMAELLEVPATDSTYGLIHSDAHAGNFHSEGNQLVFFDFDDCLYTWFGYDVATILFGAGLQSWIGESDSERADAVRNFAEVFLSGYQDENEIACLQLDLMPKFIKLREFSQYAAIHTHMNVEDLNNEFAGRFLNGRQARLEAGKPYVDVDFAALV